MVADAIGAQPEVDAVEPAAGLAPENVLELRIEHARVDAVDEARVGAEARPLVAVGAVKEPVAGLVHVLGVEGVAREGVVALPERRRHFLAVAGLRVQVLEADLVLLAQAEKAVDAADVVVVVAAAAAGVENAQGRGVADVVAVAEDAAEDILVQGDRPPTPGWRG